MTTETQQRKALQKALPELARYLGEIEAKVSSIEKDTSRMSRFFGKEEVDKALDELRSGWKELDEKERAFLSKQEELASYESSLLTKDVQLQKASEALEEKSKLLDEKQASLKEGQELLNQGLEAVKDAKLINEREAQRLESIAEDKDIKKLRKRLQDKTVKMQERVSSWKNQAEAWERECRLLQDQQRQIAYTLLNRQNEAEFYKALAEKYAPSEEMKTPEEIKKAFFAGKENATFSLVPATSQSSEDLKGEHSEGAEESQDSSSEARPEELSEVEMIASPS